MHHWNITAYNLKYLYIGMINRKGVYYDENGYPYMMYNGKCFYIHHDVKDKHYVIMADSDYGCDKRNVR